MARSASNLGTAKKLRPRPTSAASRGHSANDGKANIKGVAPQRKTVVSVDAPSASANKSPQRRRRSADPGKRRDPARTRQLILDAASEEFGRFGYDGARVMRIAERAGVAHQLISYHFGGKRGLFDALSDRWIGASTGAGAGTESLATVLSKLVHQTNDDPNWGRVLLREGQQSSEHAVLADRLAFALAHVRQRQAYGEIHADLDPGIVALVLFAANMAPIAMPHITRALCQVDPADPAFVDYYAEQLGRMLRHFGEPPC